MKYSNQKYDYYAFFKCRLCGEIFDNGAVTSNKDFTVGGTIALINGFKISCQFPNMIEIHYCKNGSVGIADFIGWKKE